MANKLYEEEQSKSTPNGLFSRFMQNPMQALLASKYNIPQEYSNNPEQIINYLLNSGQITQQQLDSMVSRAQKMGVKI